VGFYAAAGATGNALAGCVKDVLLRFQLPYEKLRGQTYDGAFSMDGEYNGCQPARPSSHSRTTDLCSLRWTLQQSCSQC